MNSGAVSHVVRVKPLALEREDMPGRGVDMFLQDQTHTKAREQLATMIAEHALLFV